MTEHKSHYSSVLTAYDVEGTSTKGQRIRTRILAIAPGNARRVAGKLIGCDAAAVSIIKTSEFYGRERDKS